MAQPSTEDDTHLTLEEALAFIDAHYDVPQRHESGADDAKAARKRARNQVAAARTHRKRRAELLQLREESAALEAMLAALVSRRGAVATEQRAVLGANTALDEVARLSTARALNRRLREACGRQQEALQQLRSVLQKRANLKCVQELLRDAAVGSAAANAPTSDRGLLLMDLRDRLRSFSYESTASITHAASETVLDESRTRVVLHPTHGRVVETVSSIQIPCELEEGWRFLLSVVCDSYRARAGVDAKALPTVGHSTSEKEFSITLCDPRRSHAVTVDSLALSESCLTPDWKLFLWESIVSLRGDGVCVRARGWTAMVRTSDASCVLHQRHDLGCTNSSRSGTESFSSSAETKFLVDSLLLKTRRDQRRAEDVLAERFGSFVENAVPLAA